MQLGWGGGKNWDFVAKNGGQNRQFMHLRLVHYSPINNNNNTS